MKTLARVLSVLIVLPILASCSTQSSNEAHVKPADSDTHTAADAPNRGIYLESGEFIEFGTFNKHAVDLFDPCQELPLEALTAIGFPAGERPESNQSTQVNVCSTTLFDQMDNPWDLIAVGVSDVPRQAYIDAGVIFHDQPSSAFQEIYSYNTTGTDYDRQCEAGVETQRGELFVIVESFNEQVTQAALCNQAIVVMEDLLNVSGDI